MLHWLEANCIKTVYEWASEPFILTLECFSVEENKLDCFERKDRFYL